MGKQNIYLNDWLAIHPYTAVQQSDTYFVKLANRLYDETAASIPYEVRMDLSLYAAAYLEDIILQKTEQTVTAKTAMLLQF